MVHLGDITKINGATLGSLFDGIGGFPLCWDGELGERDRRVPDRRDEDEIWTLVIGG